MVKLIMMHKILVVIALMMVLVACTPQAPTATPQPTAAPTAAATAESETKSVRILRLDSNHAEFAWSGEIRRGVIQALSESGYTVGDNLVLDERYLDTKRQTSTEYLEKISA